MLVTRSVYCLDIDNVMKYSFLLFVCLIPLSICAQSTTYYSKSGEPASKRNCHYYAKREGIKHGRDTVVTYYCSNDALRSVQPLDYRGNPAGITLFYFENGTMSSRTNYNDVSGGHRREEWYPNGKRQREVIYERDSSTPKLINYWDSTGNQMVLNGNGFCRCVSAIPDDGYLVEWGKVVEGERDSVWVGVRNGKDYYNETYGRGELVSGISFDDEGKSYTYSAIQEIADPPNGMKAFLTFVGENVQYPKRARKLGIEGKVFVAFVVEKNGLLSEIEVEKGIDKECDMEAVRVIMLSKQWSPGRQRGQAVRQKMVLPLTFKLR